jgi:hypothetical protein
MWPRDFSLSGGRITFVENFKYLGVWFSTTNKRVDETHIMKAKEKALVAASSLCGMLKKFEIYDFKTISNLFSSLVESQLYGMEVLPCEYIEVRDEVLKFFYCKLYGLLSATPIEFITLCFAPKLSPTWFLERHVHFLDPLLLYDIGSLPNEAIVHARTLLYPVGKGWFADVLKLFTLYAISVPPGAAPATMLLNFGPTLLDSVLHESRSAAGTKPTLKFFMDSFQNRPTPEMWEVFDTTSFEVSRSLLLLLAGNIQWSSFFSAPRRTCSLCYSSSMYSEHFFICEVAELVFPFPCSDLYCKVLLAASCKDWKS